MAANIDWLKYEQAEITVTLSASEKSLKEKAKSFVSRISSEIGLIETQEHADEIMVEYKQTLLLADSIRLIQRRYEALQKEKMARAASRKKTLPFAFSAKHVEYIRRCAANQINVAEGAVRAGKTVDNVFAFAHELKTTPDKIHLATGSTAANAKLNIGDANGFGLEHIFRGQSHWGKYKGNDCLAEPDPDNGIDLSEPFR